MFLMLGNPPPTPWDPRKVGEVEGLPRHRIMLGGFGMGGALVLKTVRRVGRAGGAGCRVGRFICSFWGGNRLSGHFGDDKATLV